ncbi:MAG TPA: metallophosphoesterase, partial [Pyrinomonadaceae bacterium]
MKKRFGGALSKFRVSARGGRLSLRAWLALALALLALVALPASINLAVQEPSEITFAVIGDFGANDANELSVSNLVKSWNPDFIITVGDNNYPDGEAATIDANIGKYYHEFIYPYAGSYGAGASANRFWPALGNHDWDNLTGAKIQPYLDYFALPGNERYYEFVRGPVHFFVVDSDTREPDGVTSTSVQGQWVQSRLAVSTAPWKIVYFHHPPFSSRTSWTNLQWPFKQWGASAVMAGHAHIYERVLRDGFPYFTNGLGGDSLGSFSTAIEGSMVRFGSDYGAMRVRASSTSITFEFITRSGTVVDTYTMSRNANPPAAPTNLSATTVSTSQIDLAWTNNSTNEDGFQVEQSTDGVNFTRIATVAPNVNAYSNTGLQPAATYYYRVRAFNSGGDGAYSPTASATTQASGTTNRPPTLAEI